MPSNQLLQTDKKNYLFSILNRTDSATKLDRVDSTNATDINTSRRAETSTRQTGRAPARVTGNMLKRMLQNNMVQFFHYPQIALKRGWQGQVMIGIRIEANGYISQTKLINSSGYGTLDRAALVSARKIKSLPNAIALLNGQIFDLQFPVIYRLQDG